MYSSAPQAHCSRSGAAAESACRNAKSFVLMTKSEVLTEGADFLIARQGDFGEELFVQICFFCGLLLHHSCYGSCLVVLAC